MEGAAPAEDASGEGATIIVRAFGRLSLPDYSMGSLPDRSRAAYLAVSTLVQHITSLQPELSSASADTHVQGASRHHYQPHFAAWARNHSATLMLYCTSIRTPSCALECHTRPSMLTVSRILEAEAIAQLRCVEDTAIFYAQLAICTVHVVNSVRHMIGHMCVEV